MWNKVAVGFGWLIFLALVLTILFYLMLYMDMTPRGMAGAQLVMGTAFLGPLVFAVLTTGYISADYMRD